MKETIQISDMNMCFYETEEIKDVRCYCIREEKYCNFTRVIGEKKLNLTSGR